MGFRRIRNQPKRLRSGNAIQDPIGDQVKYQRSVHKFPGFRQEVYHSTLRTGNPYPIPKIGDPEFTTAPWDELRCSFHSFGEDGDGVFKLLWQKLYLDPVVHHKNAWGNTVTQTPFKWARYNANEAPYFEYDGTLRTLQTFHSVTEISAGQGDIHDHSRLWGEIRVENPEKSTGGDGKFWFYFRNLTGTKTTVAITKLAVFKYGALVKEYPLVELYKAPLDPATTTIPTPNLSDDADLRRYWRRTSRHWDDTSTPATYEDLVEPNYYDAEQDVAWKDNNNNAYATYYVGSMDSSVSWPTYWRHSPRHGFPASGTSYSVNATSGGNGIINGITPYIAWRATNSGTQGISAFTCFTINPRSTYTNPSNATQNWTELTGTYVNPEP
tara:strand:- start:432 stop:1580 length:1149 start_codon:yes stop_codon:yes gene_type:complete